MKQGPDNQTAFPGKGFLGILLTLSLFLCGSPACDSITNISSDNPHPPGISNLKVSPTVLRTGRPLTFSFDYHDDGADIVDVFVNDKNSNFFGQGVPPPDAGENFVLFPGTAGTTAFIIASFSGRQLGPHTLVVWVEDSEGSLSNELEYTITIVP